MKDYQSFIRFYGFLLQNVTVYSKRTEGNMFNLLEECSNEMAGLHTSVLYVFDTTV